MKTNEAIKYILSERGLCVFAMRCLDEWLCIHLHSAELIPEYPSQACVYIHVAINVWLSFSLELP